jgi:hypothetical protein
MNYIAVNVTQPLAVTPYWSGGQAENCSIWITTHDLKISWCERAVTLINDDYISLGQGQLVRLEASRPDGVDTGNLNLVVQLWVLPGHDDPMINAKLYEFVTTLLDQLAAVGQKEDTAALIHGTLDDLRRDHGLATPGWCLQQNTPVPSSE